MIDRDKNNLNLNYCLEKIMSSASRIFAVSRVNIKPVGRRYNKVINIDRVNKDVKNDKDVKNNKDLPTLEDLSKWLQILSSHPTRWSA